MVDWKRKFESTDKLYDVKIGEHQLQQVCSEDFEELEKTTAQYQFEDQDPVK